jgi:hypothetical protein
MKNKNSYKPGDIVLIKSRVGSSIPQIHVKLVERHVRKEFKGNTMDWPGYIYWDAVLVKQSEVEVLRKRWSIPFSFPDDVATIVFDDDIVRKERKKRKNSVKRKQKPST